MLKKELLTVARAIVVCTVAVFSIAGTASAETATPLHHWTFEEGTGRSAGDTGGQNGALMGSSTGFGWASGKVGTALAMDGTDGTGIALPDGFLKGSQGSFSLWFDALELTDRNVIFSARSISDKNVYMIFALDRDGRPYLQFRTTTNGTDRKAQGVRLINRNEWVHVVFTADGVGYHMYVNGEEIVMAGENIGRWFPDVTNQTLQYRIGLSDATPFSGSWKGYLDDIQIFDRPLGQTEITALFQEGNSSKPTVPFGVRPRVTITTSPEAVRYGQNSTLQWTSVNVDQCSASGDWSNPIGTSGERTVESITKDVSFTISCVGKDGTAEATASVRIGTTTEETKTTGVIEVPLTNETTVVTPSSTETDRQTLIRRLLVEIIALIGELQKQLVLMKAATH